MFYACCDAKIVVCKHLCIFQPSSIDAQAGQDDCDGSKDSRHYDQSALLVVVDGIHDGVGAWRASEGLEGRRDPEATI